MITAPEALSIILRQEFPLKTMEISVEESLHHFLKEDIRADRDFPPFDRVSMDGIAIDIHRFENGQRSFTIENVQAAGSPQLALQNPENCIEVMTGAVLPKNTNVVIPYEQVEMEGKTARVLKEELTYFKNIHKKGLDRAKDSILIARNRKISAAEIGIMATVGKTTVKVAKPPNVLIVSTGNELVDIPETPLPHQIRRSNVYMLKGLLRQLQLRPEIAHLPDAKEEIRDRIGRYLQQYDVLIFSGSVSKGKYDYLPETLRELGVKELFHKVAIRPGKPFWFGAKDRLPVFAFPGNPVSTFMGCVKYFFPWYYKVCGMTPIMEKAVLTEDFEFKPPLTYFLQVTLQNINGELFATPKKGKGSGDLANLVDADAFLELPQERAYFKKGDSYPVLRYRF